MKCLIYGVNTGLTKEMFTSKRQIKSYEAVNSGYRGYFVWQCGAKQLALKVVIEVLCLSLHREEGSLSGLLHFVKGWTRNGERGLKTLALFPRALGIRKRRVNTIGQRSGHGRLTRTQPEIFLTLGCGFGCWHVLPKRS